MTLLRPHLQTLIHRPVPGRLHALGAAAAAAATAGATTPTATQAQKPQIQTSKRVNKHRQENSLRPSESSE